MFSIYIYIYIYIYIVTGWRITWQGLLEKCPAGWIYSQAGECRQNGGEVQALVGAPVPWVLSFLDPGVVSPCCAPVGLVGHPLLSVGEIRGWVSAQSHGEVSPVWQGLHGLCSHRVMSCSCDRSACDEDGQVFLACFQGDADEASGRSSHIYIYILIFIYLRKRVTLFIFRRSIIK